LVFYSSAVTELGHLLTRPGLKHPDIWLLAV